MMEPPCCCCNISHHFGQMTRLLCIQYSILLGYEETTFDPSLTSYLGGPGLRMSWGPDKTHGREQPPLWVAEQAVYIIIDIFLILLRGGRVH